MASILVVDDDHSVRMTVALLLLSQGHSVITAANGFEALLQMKTALPDLVISDLQMPKMSGFEFLLVVRRLFPGVLVVASSAGFSTGGALPSDVIADAFHAKNGNPGALLKLVAEMLISGSTYTARRELISFPVWVAQDGCDANGQPYVDLNCQSCLRTFRVLAKPEHGVSVTERPCNFCCETVRYVIDFSSAAFVSRPRLRARSIGR
jgi:CheY-like chemotaxis protein